MTKKLFLVDVNNFMTWIRNPEKIASGIIEAPWAVPNFVWPVDSHPGQRVQGKYVVRWWFEEK